MADFLSSWKVIGFTIAAIITIFIKTIKNLIEFNDGTLKRRRSKYLQHLRDEAGSNTNIIELVDALRAEEALQKITGIYASPGLAEAIKDLFDSKKFSIREIRAASFYLRLDENNKLRSNSGKLGKFLKRFIGGFIAFYALYTAALTFTFLQRKDLPNIIAATVFLLLFFLVSWYFGRDVREVFSADRLDKKILMSREG